MDLLFAGLGLVILLLAGDALVKGAVNLSLRIGVPALIVSLTIVAFGTSAPELLISVKAVLEDSPGIALGNVVGSNIANILLVLGLPALVYGLATGACETKRTFLFMLAATVLFIALAMSGKLVLWHGLLMLGALALVLADAFREARAHRAGDRGDEVEELEGADPTMPGWRIWLYLGLGLVGLPLGADLLVDAAVEIARDFGVSETAIGLTLVAVGTSLPELATTIMAARQRQADVALGNVIGSNMFNLLAIMGITAIVAPVPVGQAFLVFDLWAMLVASLILVPFVFLRWNMGRAWGLVLTVIYVGYIWSALGH